MPTRTIAEALDLALEELEAGHMPMVGAGLRPMVGAAVQVQRGLPPIPVGTRFAADLALRLTESGGLRRGLRVLEALTRRELRQRGRLLAAGAVSSAAAVGVGVTAFAVWRGSHRGATLRRLGGH